MQDFSGTRVAAIFAHPDDEAFTVGGVLSAFADRGAHITLICATRGEEGEIAHPSLATPENLGAVREQELLDAAAILGISDVHFLDYRDSGMVGTEPNQRPDAFIQQPHANVAGKIAEILANVHPDVVLTFSEDGGYWHPDHIHIHESVVVLSQREPDLVPHLYFSSFPREYLLELVNRDHGAFEGMSDERLYTMGQPYDTFTIITNVEPFVERKTAAFEAHRTQQPKEGAPVFLESEEDRRRFVKNEYYIRGASTDRVSDPLALLALDLNGSNHS